MDWPAAVAEIAERWDRLEDAGREPEWPDDEDLTAAVGDAMRAGDQAAVERAVAAWHSGWSRYLERYDVVGELEALVRDPERLEAAAWQPGTAKLLGEAERWNREARENARRPGWRRRNA